MSAFDQEALDRASWELQRHFGREGSIYGIKACEEIARIALVAYGVAQTLPPEALQNEDMWWRDASRERPARDRLVIAWTEKYGALLANRDTSNPDFGWSCDGKVTHWMPLPSVPSPQLRSQEKP